MNEIAAVENKYGPVMFRMGLTHMMDVGIRHLTDENVEEAVAQIMAQGEADEAAGKISVMTPEFQCGIVRCAAELAKFSVSDLFLYIKKHVHVSK